MRDYASGFSFGDVVSQARTALEQTAASTASRAAQDAKDTASRAAQDARSTVAHTVDTTVASVTALGNVSLRSNLNASKPLVLKLQPDPTPGISGRLLKALQPEVRIDSPGGPIVMSPYGPPTKNHGLLLLSSVGLFALGFVGIGSLLQLSKAGLITVAAVVGAVATLRHATKLPAA